MSIEKSSWVPYDIEQGVREYEEGVNEGVFCHVDEMKKKFAWMRGHVNGWYGWANDGKGTFHDFMSLLMSIHGEKMKDGSIKKWKRVSFRQEDMDSVVIMDKGKKKAKIRANRIYKNMAWMLTGKTWSKTYSERNRVPRMTLMEENEAIDFITEHYKVIHPRDRRYNNILDEFKFLIEHYGADIIDIDPWNTVVVPSGDTTDKILTNVFIDIKDFALETDTCVDIITHPRSISDVKVSKEKNAPYKLITQYDILGGTAWDMKMDGQFTVQRPNRHTDPNDTDVCFHTLKMRNREIVGVAKGMVESIKFDEGKRRYFFNGICPIDGSYSEEKKKQMGLDIGGNIFEEALNKKNKEEGQPLHKKEENKTDDMPF